MENQYCYKYPRPALTTDQGYLWIRRGGVEGIIDPERERTV